MNNENNNENYYVDNSINESNNSNNENYYVDNSFNENGVDSINNGGSVQFPNSNRGNSIAGLGKGFIEGAKAGLSSNGNNPALGVKGQKANPMNGQKKTDKNKPQNNKKNPAQGQKDSNKKKNPLPGGIDKNKNGNNKNTNRPNQNNQNNQNKEQNKDKNKGFGSKLNPLNKGGIGSKLGLGKKDSKSEGATGPNLNQVAKKGLKLAWMAAPIPVKIIVAVLFLLPIFFLIALMIFLAIFGGTTAAVTAAMCNEDETGSSYNGEDYSGSSNVKEFMCKMQDPLANGKYHISGRYGSDRGDHIHAGLDLASGGKNIPVYAAQAGTVTSSGYNKSMGYYVKINHGDVIETVYMHMVKGSLKVNAGDKVGKGQQIGIMGTTGHSTGVHLHFEIRTLPNRNPNDPTPYFSDRAAFKKNCGSSWDGELAGDSANAANDTSGVDDISYDSDSGSSSTECCDSSSSSSSSESVEGLPPIITQEFVDGAISTQTKYKVPASLTLAQIILESGGDSPGHLSGLAYQCKNLFGIKKGSCSSCATCTFKTREETSSGSSYTVSAKFRKYSNYKESIEDHGKFFVENSRYSDCFNKKTGDEWAKCVKKAGYATDVDYDEKLISLMKQYNLYQYDEYTSTNVCTLGRGSFDGKIWYFDQTDYNEPYGSYGTIATHGCGPTAMAIAVSSLLNEEHDPVELTNFACSNNYCSDSGTSSDFFKAAAKKYGLKVKQVSKSNSDEIFTALNGGNSIVIALMGKGTFTEEGHYITLTGSNDDQVFVHDPANGDGKKYNKLWDFDLIKKEASGNSPFWIISK